ncbi:hypothetical protein [Gehongia tenuis]|uniref:Uncharacterized protein n=1 Tax=Gehongia tenuis TaxID=2763655 RepID=A0A926D3X6_9FIRM|nr:hypothetical protein [Gehongia tenuis]MBC8531037.1 hypothetical protein [Gehongia tenuis]
MKYAVDLVEAIAMLLNCDYLSDLHYKTATPDQVAKLWMDVGDYSLKQYCEVGKYLLNHPCAFTNVQEARTIIGQELLRVKKGRKF